MSTYRIIGFDSVVGQLTVEHDATSQPIIVDVPIENGLYITGEALDSFIKGFIPTWHTDRLALVASGVSNADAIAALVVEPSAEFTANIETQKANAIASNQQNFEKTLAKTLLKWNVVSQDPTTIPVEVM